MIESEGKKKSLRESLYQCMYCFVFLIMFFVVVTLLLPFIKGTTIFKFGKATDKFLQGGKVTLVESFIPLSKKWEMQHQD